jgi:uncharacterized protein (TIGR02118 family)
MRKFVYVLRRRPDMTREAFQKYWREVHGPLVAKYAETVGLMRYVQVHTLHDAAARSDEVRGQMADVYDGVAELWFDPDRAKGTAEERQACNRLLAEDERNFIDFATSSMWLAKEYAFVGEVVPGRTERLSEGAHVDRHSVR